MRTRASVIWRNSGEGKDWQMSAVQTVIAEGVRNALMWAIL